MDFITDFSERTLIYNTSIHIPVTIFFIVYLVLFGFIFMRLFSALVITVYCEERNSKLKENGLDKNQVKFSFTCLNLLII